MSELSERIKAFGKYIEIGKGLGYAITIDQLAELQALEKERDANKKFADDWGKCRLELQKLKEVLEDAQTGLKWYQEEHPEDASPVDDELHKKLDELLKQSNER